MPRFKHMVPGCGRTASWQTRRSRVAVLRAAEMGVEFATARVSLPALHRSAGCPRANGGISVSLGLLIGKGLWGARPAGSSRGWHRCTEGPAECLAPSGCFLSLLAITPLTAGNCTINGLWSNYNTFWRMLQWEKYKLLLELVAREASASWDLRRPRTFTWGWGGSRSVLQEDTTSTNAYAPNNIAPKYITQNWQDQKGKRQYNNYSWRFRYPTLHDRRMDSGYRWRMDG